MLEQFKIYKNSFLMNKVRYICTIIIGLFSVAGAIIVPAIMSAKLGVFMATISKKVGGVYDYVVDNADEIEAIVNDARVAILIFITIVMITISVLNVLIEKEEYIAKINMGKPRSDTYTEIVSKSIINSLIIVILGIVVGQLVISIYGIMNDIVIKPNLKDIIVPSVVGLIIGGISSFITFLFSIDKARETKGFTK